MSSLWSRFFLVCTVVGFTPTLFAADRNFTEYDESTYHNACERLLDADLSGYFVATNKNQKMSELVQLIRLGNSSAYIVATAKLNLGAEGIRELEFSRTADGWLVGDSVSPNKRVNIL